MYIVINIQNSLWNLDINMKNIIATKRILHTLSPLLPTGPLSPYKDEKQFLEYGIQFDTFIYKNYKTTWKKVLIRVSCLILTLIPGLPCTPC